MDKLKHYLSDFKIQDGIQDVKDYLSSFELPKWKSPEFPEVKLPQVPELPKMPQFKLPELPEWPTLPKLSFPELPKLSLPSLSLPEFLTFQDQELEDCEEIEEEKSKGIMGLFWGSEDNEDESEEGFFDYGVTLFYKTIILATIVFIAVTVYVIRSQNQKRRRETGEIEERSNQISENTEKEHSMMLNGAEPRKKIISIQPKQELSDGNSSRTVFVQELRRGLVNPEAHPTSESVDKSRPIDQEQGYSYSRHIHQMTSSRVNGDETTKREIEPVSQLRVTHVPKEVEYSHHENAPVSLERHHDVQYRYTAKIDKNDDSGYSLTALDRNKPQISSEASAPKAPEPFVSSQPPFSSYQTNTTTTEVSGAPYRFDYDPQPAVSRSFMGRQPEYAEHLASPARRPLYPGSRSSATPEPQRRAGSLQPYIEEYSYSRPRPAFDDRYYGRSYDRHESIERTEAVNPSGSTSFRSFVREMDKSLTPQAENRTNQIIQQDLKQGTKAFMHGSSTVEQHSEQRKEEHQHQRSELTANRAYQEYSKTPTPPRSRGDEDKTVIFQREVRHGAKAFLREASPPRGEKTTGSGGQQSVHIEIRPTQLPHQPKSSSYSFRSESHRGGPSVGGTAISGSRREESKPIHYNDLSSSETHRRLIVHEPTIPTPAVNFSPPASGNSYSYSSSSYGGPWGGGSDLYRSNIMPSYEYSPFDDYGLDRGLARGIVGSAIQKKKQLEHGSGAFRSTHRTHSASADDTFSRAITDIRYAAERLG